MVDIHPSAVFVACLHDMLCRVVHNDHVHRRVIYCRGHIPSHSVCKHPVRDPSMSRLLLEPYSSCRISGALYGRALGIGAWAIWQSITGEVYPTHSDWAWLDPGLFAIMGSASLLGGVTRLSLATTVIIVSALRKLSFTLSQSDGLLTFADWDEHGPGFDDSNNDHQLCG